MLDDLRHSLRALRRTPMSSLAAICILAVAIGASAAVFSVVDKVLIRPLPIEEPDRVVVIWPREVANPTTIGEISNFTFRAWQNEVRSFQSLAAIGSTNWSLILREGEPATIPVAAVSGTFFQTIGVSASRGRTTTPDDDRLGGPRVAVMSHGSWVRRFGADPGIVGRSLRFDSGIYTVVGIMPEGFDYPRGAELWVPLVPDLADAGEYWKVDTVNDPSWGTLFVLGRLEADVSVEAARDEVSSLIARSAGVGFGPGMGAVLTPLDEHIFGNTEPALLALAACVGLVLLIGCANVVVLLLVRTASRADEMATRLAIGATRWRMVRQSLNDAAVLSVLGSAVGLVFAYYAGIGMDSGYVIEGQRQFIDSQKNPRANLESITPDYFRAIGTSVVRGRPFSDADALPAPRVAVVSEGLARRLWPGQDPIGKRILPPGQGPDEKGQPRWATVVGVAEDARYRGINDLRFDLYLPEAQIPGMRVKHLMVRTSLDPASFTGSIRAEARRLESTALVENAAVMGSLVDQATAPWRFSAWTLGLLGLIALLLASFGVFVTLSQSVVERTREIGIRVAVGALPRQVAGLVFREGVALTMVGITLGLSVATLTGSVVVRLLFEVPAMDAATLAGMAALFGLISAVAVYLPAWRAPRLDPTIALRRQ